MNLINSKNIKRLMLFIINLLTAMLRNIATNGRGYKIVAEYEAITSQPT